MNEAEQAPAGVDASKPSPARMYDYYLGGTANFRVDREAVNRILELVPEIKDAAWANRGFLQRTVRWMAQHGIRQFIDLGAGMPTQRCTHEVAREVAPDARVLYSDNDPGVIAQGQQILADVPDVAIIEADFRRPEQLLSHPQTARLINFQEPVGLLIVAVTQFISDADDPWRLVAEYVDALAPGSYLALSAPTGDHMVNWKLDRIVDVYATSAIPVVTARTKNAIAQFFDGLDIVQPYRGAEPCLVSTGLWYCEDPETAESDGSHSFYAAVARKPGASTLPKPTTAELGIDPDSLTWRSSTVGPGAIQVAFVHALGQWWVLMRLGDDPSGRVSVFSSFEWECFLDGAKNGEFDDASF
jgi:SAM-dependent methyltransferase